MNERAHLPTNVPGVPGHTRSNVASVPPSCPSVMPIGMTGRRARSTLNKGTTDTREGQMPANVPTTSDAHDNNRTRPLLPVVCDRCGAELARALPGSRAWCRACKRWSPPAGGPSC